MALFNRDDYETTYEAARRLGIPTGSLLTRLHNLRHDGLQPPMVDPDNPKDWLVRRRDVDVLATRAAEREA